MFKTAALLLLIAIGCIPASAGLITVSLSTEVPVSPIPPSTDTTYWDSSADWSAGSWWRPAVDEGDEANTPSEDFFTSFSTYQMLAPAPGDYTFTIESAWMSLVYVYEPVAFKPWERSDPGGTFNTTFYAASSSSSFPASATYSLVAGRTYTVVTTGVYASEYGDYTLNIESAALGPDVPEPGTFLLLGLGIAGLPLLKRLRG